MPASAIWMTLAGLALALLPIGRPRGLVRAVLTSLPLFLFALASHGSGGPAFLTLALFFSGLGEVARLRDTRAARLYGLAATALSRLSYILLFLGLSQAPLWDGFATAPLFAAATVAAALSTEIWLIPYAAAAHWPLRASVALIAATVLAALTFPPVAPGAVLLGSADLALTSRRGGRGRGHLAATAAYVFGIAGHALILWAILAP